jgi:carboxymethylenebutenolidase
MPSFWEKVEVEGREMDLYASVPSGSGPFAAVVVAHPASGVGEFTQSVADRLAAAGYAAVAPNRFHRVPQDVLASGQAAGQFLNDLETIADMNATVDFLRNHPAIDGERIGVIGFCSGGRIAWLSAATNSHYRAAVPYYGGNIMATVGNATATPFDLAEGINCPMLFHFGEVDANPSQDDMRKLDAELTRLGKEHEFRTYSGAGHAFLDQTGARYHEEAANASWPVTVEFFATHLAG